MPPLNAKVVDTAPDEPALTPYDEQHAVTYARLLDAEADNADWREVARIVLQIDPTLDPTEPPRVCRRPFGLSYAAMADCSSMA
jgi:hypothetical protein